MKSSTLMIDTGAPRSVTGHVVSGALASGALAGALNYNRYKKDEMTSQEAMANTVKLSAQGGIATGSAIAAANYVGQGNLLGMLTAVSIGAMGIYAVEKASDMMNENKMIEAVEAEETELIEEAGE